MQKYVTATSEWCLYLLLRGLGCCLKMADFWSRSITTIMPRCGRYVAKVREQRSING